MDTQMAPSAGDQNGVVLQKSGVGRIRMIGRTVSVLLLTAACLQRAVAQPTRDGLDATQKQGRQLLAQSWCAHLRPAAVQGNRRWQRRRDGTPRMPGFKHYLGRAEIDA